MDLLPYPLGPINPKVTDLVFALPLFAVVYLGVTRALRRLRRALAARHDATVGTARRAAAVRAAAEAERARTERLLADAHHDAVRARQRAREEGAALLAAAREDGRREQDALVARARDRVASERATADAELRMTVSELASALASRIVGEPVTARTEPGN
ncbi:ATP synthase F0 subunit B [Streptomyces sp. NPDC054842]